MSADNTSKQVNERVKRLRQALGMSQARFAAGIPISSGYIAGIELGNRRVNERIIKLISVTYGASMNWLKTGAGGDDAMFSQAAAENLKRVTELFQELRPAYQDYVLLQIEQLLEMQQLDE